MAVILGDFLLINFLRIKLGSYRSDRLALPSSQNMTPDYIL